MKFYQIAVLGALVDQASAGTVAQGGCCQKASECIALGTPNCCPVYTDATYKTKKTVTQSNKATCQTVCVDSSIFKTGLQLTQSGTLNYKCEGGAAALVASLATTASVMLMLQ